MNEYLVLIQRTYPQNTLHEARVVIANDPASAIFGSGFNSNEVIRVEKL